MSPSVATPRVVSPDDGEHRYFRNRPGTFTLKIDPKNGGSEHLVVLTEDMAPGDRIPTHRHPLADELIIVQSGNGRVTLGEKTQEAHAGSIVFIPRNTYVSMENNSGVHLMHTDVFSSPGYENYMRAISVTEGESIVPLSKSEIDALRAKYAPYGVYR